MTISSSYEIQVRSGGRSLFRRTLDILELPYREDHPVSVRAEDALMILVSIPEPGRHRLRLGSEVLKPTGETGGAIEYGNAPGEPPLLFNEFGETEIVLEEIGDEDPAAHIALISIAVGVLPRPPVERAYRVMFEDLQAIHEALAQDVVARSRGNRSLWGTKTVRLTQEAVERELRSLEARFRQVVERIGRQPSTALVRKREPKRYRSGDHMDAQALSSLVLDRFTRFDGQGRVACAGRVATTRPETTLDLPEHRHIASGLKRLILRCRDLKEHSRAAADLLEKEKARWHHRSSGEMSVFDKRDMPRIEKHREIAARAQTLESGFRRSLESAEFLLAAGEPRTPLSPTPAFMGRPAYREAYNALVEARDLLGLMVDVGRIGIGLRNLASLYEYWCFVLTVNAVKRALPFTGPEATGTFSLIHNLYRPELAPGQAFTFSFPGGGKVRVIYEPEFPAHLAQEAPESEFVASLTPNPLRPDIVVEFRSPGDRPVLMVLDAKATENFSSPKLFSSMTDYRTMIHDPKTGYQPVQQAWIMHRDTRAPVFCSLPGYLDGKLHGRQTSILGAIPCVPLVSGQAPRMLEKVISRFIETRVEDQSVNRLRPSS